MARGQVNGSTGELAMSTYGGKRFPCFNDVFQASKPNELPVAGLIHPGAEKEWIIHARNLSTRGPAARGLVEERR
eukprot:7676234-Pyramimonas_sp.AAC.2